MLQTGGIVGQHLSALGLNEHTLTTCLRCEMSKILFIIHYWHYSHELFIHYWQFVGLGKNRIRNVENVISPLLLFVMISYIFINILFICEDSFCR